MDGFIGCRAVGFGILAGELRTGVERGLQSPFDLPDGNVVKVEDVRPAAFQGRDKEVLAGYRGEDWLDWLHE